VRRLGTLLGVIALAALAACGRELQVHPWAGPHEALATLRARAEAIRTLQSSARVVLTRPDGDSVHLDAALVASFPDHLRLRAWKFGHAVFDLTWTPGGLWIAAASDARSDPATLALTADGFGKAWLLLSPEFFSEPLASVRTPDSGRSFFVERRSDAAGGSATVVCEVDRATLTPRQYTTFDESGTPRATLVLDHYRDFDGTLWPAHIEARGPSGTVAVTIDSAQFNQPLPERAFVPPADAVKQP
jgi:hypothetical protein